jgi:hypothetical protein
MQSSLLRDGCDDAAMKAEYVEPETSYLKSEREKFEGINNNAFARLAWEARCGAESEMYFPSSCRCNPIFITALMQCQAAVATLHATMIIFRCVKITVGGSRPIQIPSVDQSLKRGFLYFL